MISLAKQHLLVVIFFENTELAKLIEEPASDLRQVYHQAMAERLAYEKTDRKGTSKAWHPIDIDHASEIDD